MGYFSDKIKSRYLLPGSRSYGYSVRSGVSIPSPAMFWEIQRATRFYPRELLLLLRMDYIDRIKNKYLNHPDYFGEYRQFGAVEKLEIKIPALPYLTHGYRFNLQAGREIPSPKMLYRICRDSGIDSADWLSWILWKKDSDFEKKYLTFGERKGIV